MKVPAEDDDDDINEDYIKVLRMSVIIMITMIDLIRLMKQRLLTLMKRGG